MFLVEYVTEKSNPVGDEGPHQFSWRSSCVILYLLRPWYAHHSSRKPHFCRLQKLRNLLFIVIKSIWFLALLSGYLYMSIIALLQSELATIWLFCSNHCTHESLRSFLLPHPWGPTISRCLPFLLQATLKTL